MAANKEGQKEERKDVRQLGGKETCCQHEYEVVNLFGMRVEMKYISESN